ncbi:MAG: PEP/pyruvate-binding domain-containing protein [Desulfobulbaceae bacterium]|nr:PEP/pyruvate-binding domain-containing protein [Desulfobulbaceae bacterium]
MTTIPAQSRLTKTFRSWLSRLSSPTVRPLSLPLLFETFQKVLASNNKALEGITDMGEKLSGNYIFDINYIKTSYAALSADFQNSIAQFATLTGGRYPIEETFSTIHSLIDDMIQGQEGRTTDLLISLKDITWDRAREVGGKNFHLAELGNSLSLPIPDGFVLTGKAFTEFFLHNGLSDIVARLKSSNPSEHEISKLRQKILESSFPPALEQQVTSALERIRLRHGVKAQLAVRSSADEEDGYFSFAGQFESVLNVPLRTTDLCQAYCIVVASLFSSGAVAYQQQLNYDIGSLRMAVGCQLLVDAVASGVTYTADPAKGDKGVIVINAAWGLGPSVVDGMTDTDVYVVRKGNPPILIETKIGRKESMTVPAGHGEIKQEPTPEENRSRMCLPPETIISLAARSTAIEGYFKCPQDIEWAMQADGSIVFLQSRALKVDVEIDPASESKDRVCSPPPEDHPLVFSNAGIVVQKGAAAGNAFLLQSLADLDKFPMGAILVAKNDSPQFIRIMPYAVAIITGTGGLASHMASVCREFKIPTLVNCGEAISKIHHGQKITLALDANGDSAIYEGQVTSILAQRRREEMKMDELYEYRRQKYLLRHIAPLNLINPLEDEFVPEKCRTLHDVLRFIHEKSVQTIIESSSSGSGGLKALKKLDLPVAAGLQVLDLGDGLNPVTTDTVTADQVRSLPMQAIIEGLTTPGAWHTEAITMEVGDMVGSMMRVGDLTAGGTNMAARNIAVISAEYVNLAMRFGYHFNLIDSYCTERAANNHVYFRFVGGAADMTKRSRRINLIDQVLKEFGFLSKAKGDLIIARLSHIKQEEVLASLRMAGRLIAFMRQLDAVLRNDAQIEIYAKRFLEGNYDL